MKLPPPLVFPEGTFPLYRATETAKLWRHLFDTELKHKYLWCCAISSNGQCILYLGSIVTYRLSKLNGGSTMPPMLQVCEVVKASVVSVRIWGP